MKDPFEEFLEDAMAGPDLELGHEMRRRLLESAVSGEAPEGENVIRMDHPEDADEQAGFDWMVGELPASRGLLERMIEDRRFFTLLDRNRRFLITLRQAMRGEGAAAVPAERKRPVPIAAFAAAAAVVLAAGTVFLNRPAGKAQPQMAAGGAAAEGAAAPAPRAAQDGPAGAAETRQAARLPGSGEASPPDVPAPVIPGFAPMPEPGDLPGIAGLGGSGQSLPAAAGPTEEEPEMALNLPPRRGESVPEDAAYSLFETEEAPEIAALGDYEFFSDTGLRGGWYFRSGDPASTSLVDDDGTIPEPGAAIPVVIGMMVLLLRRKRAERGER